MSDLYLQAKTIAEEALEVPAPEREAWILARCAGDDALHQEAAWLLSAVDTASGDGPATAWPALGLLFAPLDEGARIDAAQPGQYRVLRLLGEGGMGTVYLAQRSDGDTRQQVALKLLSGGGAAWNTSLAARMADERRILALLHHPNIAHLVDGGVSRDGQPFIAMEYVEGERIDHWCATRALPLRRRLQLFLKVCAAVEHAHQRLVIHRDLKPANILVDAGGEPKLLDFGIARLMEGAGTDADATRTEHRALTLAYASPEHVEGRPLTTATDVWSLGIVLYELLAGVRPHQETESAHLLPGAIVSSDIRVPSARLHTGNRDVDTSVADTARAVGRIPADIDAIVLKALRNDPAQRYASVAALAQDIRLFLDSRPVSARSGHALYRTRRFAWRHRWRLGAATAAVVLLAGYLVDRERQFDEVTAERNKALALSGFMTDLFANADPSQSRGEQITVREVLDRGAVDLRKRTDLPANARADLLLAVGDAYSGLQLTQSAMPVMEEVLRLKRSAGAPSIEQAGLLSRITLLHAQKGENAKAIASARQGQALLSPDRPDQFAAWIGLRVQELRNLELGGEMGAAELVAPLHEVLGMLDAAGGADTAMARLEALQTLANVRLRAGDLDGALRTQEQAVAHAGATMGDRPAWVMVARSDLGTMLLDKDLQAGLAMLEAIDHDYVRLVGEHTAPRAVMLNQIAVGYTRARDQERSLQFHRQAAKVAREAVGTDNRLYLQLAVSEAFSLSKLSRFAEAEALLRDVLPHLAARSSPGVDAVNHAYALAMLAQTLLDAGEDAHEALGLAREAEDIVSPHADGGVMIVYENAIRATVAAQLQLGDKTRAAAAVARYRALLDARGEPADSRWRKNAEDLQASIPA